MTATEVKQLKATKPMKYWTEWLNMYRWFDDNVVAVNLHEDKYEFRISYGGSLPGQIEPNGFGGYMGIDEPFWIHPNSRKGILVKQTIPRKFWIEMKKKIETLPR